MNSHEDTYGYHSFEGIQVSFIRDGTLIALNRDNLVDGIKIQTFIRAVPTKCRIESSDYVGLPADRDRVQMSLDFSASMYHSPAIAKAADEIKKMWNDNSNNE